MIRNNSPPTKLVEGITPRDDSKSVTFDLSSPEKSPNIRTLDGLGNQQFLNTDRQKAKKLEENLSLIELKTIGEKENTEQDENGTDNATEGAGEDKWKQDPNLQMLRSELDMITNPNAGKFQGG